MLLLLYDRSYRAMFCSASRRSCCRTVSQSWLLLRERRRGHPPAPRRDSSAAPPAMAAADAEQHTANVAKVIVHAKSPEALQAVRQRLVTPALSEEVSPRGGGPASFAWNQALGRRLICTRTLL